MTEKPSCSHVLLLKANSWNDWLITICFAFVRMIGFSFKMVKNPQVRTRSNHVDFYQVRTCGFFNMAHRQVRARPGTWFRLQADENAQNHPQITHAHNLPHPIFAHFCRFLPGNGPVGFSNIAHRQIRARPGTWFRLHADENAKNHPQMI